MVWARPYGLGWPHECAFSVYAYIWYSFLNGILIQYRSSTEKTSLKWLAWWYFVFLILFCLCSWKALSLCVCVSVGAISDRKRVVSILTFAKHSLQSDWTFWMLLFAMTKSNRLLLLLVHFQTGTEAKYCEMVFEKSESARCRALDPFVWYCVDLNKSNQLRLVASCLQHWCGWNVLCAGAA